MAKTRSMTRNENHVNASSSKRIKNYDNSGTTRWSDLNHDVLILVMMQLGVVDFIAFSGVCKSWRSLATLNGNMFMVSKPPLLMWIPTRYYDNKCCIWDFEGRKFKTILPRYSGRCVGVTCGYLIFISNETYDFWLVNPITRHEFHFPHIPSHVYRGLSKVSAILVFSSSIAKWVFVMSTKLAYQIWYHIAGEGAWNHVSFTFHILDIHAFKGKIYTINAEALSFAINVCEMSINPESELVLHEIKNFPKQQVDLPMFVSSSENLYVADNVRRHQCEVYKLDLGEQKWVPFEETRDENALFVGSLKNGVAVKPKSSASLPYRRFLDTEYSGKRRFYTPRMWYFPHECLDVKFPT